MQPIASARRIVMMRRSQKRTTGYFVSEEMASTWWSASPYRRGDRVSVEAQSVERDDIPCAALLVRFTSDDGGFSAEQLTFLRVFLRGTTIFDVKSHRINDGGL